MRPSDIVSVCAGIAGILIIIILAAPVEITGNYAKSVGIRPDKITAQPYYCVDDYGDIFRIFLEYAAQEVLDETFCISGSTAQYKMEMDYYCKRGDVCKTRECIYKTPRITKAVIRDIDCADVPSDKLKKLELASRAGP